MSNSPLLFILDVDGVLTDGKFYYSDNGKVLKAFGPDDHDGLSLLKPYMEVRFVTGDHRGFGISKARIVEDMNFPLDLVSTTQRIDWIEERWDPLNVVYMGDGLFDHYVFKRVGYSIAPANADPFTREQANFVTQRCGGDRAVAEAALHLLERFFMSYDRGRPPHHETQLNGKYSV